MANPVVTFEMENGDIMKAELYPEIAPNTVRNFICPLHGKSHASGFRRQPVLHHA